MKKMIALVCILISVKSFAQHSCCSASSTEQFTQLAMNDKFVSEHMAPEPLNYSEAKGESIVFECSDGEKGKGYLISPAKKSDTWLFIFHEWWGLNDYIKREADNFAKDFPDINILAIDLYDGKVAESPALAQEIMSSMKDERVRSIITGAITYAGKNARIATLGWCMGGGWSLQASIMAGKKAIGCVMYYGMPEKDQKKIEGLAADVYGIFGKKDKWINEEVVNQFAQDMNKAGKKFTYKWYDADHAFANPSNPKHDKLATADARKNVISFLKTHLK